MIEECDGFIMVIVDLSLDEISIPFSIEALRHSGVSIEEADSIKLPIQSLEVVSVAWIDPG